MISDTPYKEARPRREKIFFFGLIILIMGLGVCIFGEAHAHPEDDFCGPGSGIEQDLCRQLSALDRADADLTHPLLDAAGNPRSAFGSAMVFLKIGVGHILPGGLDHILFVFALFLAAHTMRRLILQISVFTLAHTVTLGLTAAGVIKPPASIVEPLIALSIAIVAIETLFNADQSKRRLLIVFGFGLFHGMGFAGFIREIGLPPEQFWWSLIGFNIGVEIGQLAIILAAALLSIPMKRAVSSGPLSYRQVIVIPSALIIAAIGLWWFIARSLGL